MAPSRPPDGSPCWRAAKTSLGGGDVWRGGNPVHASPLSVAPRQIPARASRRLAGHVIEAGRAKRMAAEQPRHRHPAARPEPEPRECLIGVLRAGGDVPAMEPDQGRESDAISFD